MPETQFHPLAAKFYRNTDAQFWLLQLVGWFGLSLISFFSLTVWYNQQTELSYVAHTLVQSALGILVSWPLRPLAHAVWDVPFWRRFSLISLGLFVCSGLWALLRI